MMKVRSVTARPSLVLLSVVLTDIVALILARHGMVGKVIQLWYHTFTLGAFVADVASITFGIYLALFWFQCVRGKDTISTISFLGTVVVIQLLHDLLFAFVIRRIPKRRNKMVDVFHKYIHENGWNILFVDALMMSSSVLLIELLYSLPEVAVYTLLTLCLYLSMFLIY